MPVELAEVVVADPPEAWEAGGFLVDADGSCRVGRTKVRLVGRDAGKRIVSWSFRGLPAGTGDLDGLPTSTTDDPAPEGAIHPNGATFLDHIVLYTPDVDRTVAAFTDAGIEARRTRAVPAEQYGFSALQTFFRAGEAILELLGPEEPNGDGPAGFFGLAWTVADLDALPGLYGAALGNVKDAVQPGRRIATLRHKDVGMSVATAFMSPEP